MPNIHTEILTIPVDQAWLLAVHVLRPERVQRPEPVVMLHGLGGNRLHFDLSPRYSLARAAVARGYAVYILELRGAGLSRPLLDGPVLPSWGFLNYLNVDLPAIFQTIRAHSGSQDLIGIGHSMGGMLLLAAAANAYADFRCMVTIGTPLLSYLPLGTKEQQFLDWTMRWIETQQGHMLPLRRLSGLAERMLKPLLMWMGDGVALNPHNIEPNLIPRLIRESIDDIPFQLLRELAVAIRYPSSSTPYAHEFHLDRIRSPILLLSGSNDRVVPPASVTALAQRLRSSDVRLREMGQRMGDRIDYGHVDLLVGRHAPDDVYHPVLDFIDEYAA